MVSYDSPQSALEVDTAINVHHVMIKMAFPVDREKM